jgi:L-lactate dehydrogenase
VTGAKVGVIGAGAVGQSVAMLLAASDWCEELLIASGSIRSAAALAADLEDMKNITGSAGRISIRATTNLAASDAVVVCPRARFTNSAQQNVRAAGVHANAPLIKEIGRALRGYPGIALVVTNPVDVMAAVFADASGSRRVFGIGSAMDSARYRSILADLLGVPVSAVEGRVVGEHGDGAVVCASSTRVHGRPAKVPLDAVHAQLRDRPGMICAGIGRTRSGPAAAILTALRASLGLDDTVIELSVPHEHGWAGMPVRFTQGAAKVCQPELDETERKLLDASRARQRRLYESLFHPREGAS